MSDEIITVRPDATTMTRQRLPNYVGISAATAGATGISLNLVIIPPGVQPICSSGASQAAEPDR